MGIRCLVIILLLLTTPTFAGQGMGPGPGLGKAGGSGGGAGTISENFDTAIAQTYAGFTGMSDTATVQGWTIGSSGTDPGTFDPAYDTFYGAYIKTATGGFAGNKLDIFGCHTEDLNSNLIASSGFKLSKTFTGPFAAGTFNIKYRALSGTPTVTIKVNGASVGALTFDNTWRSATPLSVGATANILLEIECAPTVAPSGIPTMAIDNISFS